MKIKGKMTEKEIKNREYNKIRKIMKKNSEGRGKGGARKEKKDV